MVNAAQQAWCDGLGDIGAVDAEGGDVRTATGDLVDALYDYAEGTVFFKPTLAFGKNTFRSTRRGAIRTSRRIRALHLSAGSKSGTITMLPRMASRFMATSRSPWATSICRTQPVTRSW